MPCVRRTSASERPIRSRTDEAAIEHGPGAPADADVSRLEHLERDQRGVEQVPQFMGEKPEALVAACRFLVEIRLILLASESVTAPAIASSRHGSACGSRRC